MSSADTNTSFFNDLWDRRFFQFLATYVGVCWGVLQFLQFACTRYGWESAIIDKFLLIAAIMLPSVIVFIYNHGRAGDDDWKPYEKYLIPINAIVALGATFFISSAGAAEENKITYETEQIIITDDEGEEIKRNVPVTKSSATILLFPIENKKSDASIEWLRYAPSLLAHELSQDVRISTVSPFSLRYEYANYDYQLTDDIPVGSKVKIAKDNLANYFISSSLVPDPAGLKMDVSLYNTEDGTIRLQKSYTGKDIFTIYDMMSKDVNASIFDINYFEKEGVPDLPASNLITGNEKALKLYLESRLKGNGNDTAGPIELMEKAVKEDPKCAYCYAFLGQVYSVTDIAKAQESMKKAMANSSSISEKQQFYIKYYNYAVNLKPDKGEKLLYLWKSLYPNDKAPYNLIMDRLILKRYYNEAIKVGEEAVERGHSGSILPKLADLSIKTNDLDGAKKYLEKYAELYPSKAKENTMLGDIYIKTGELDKAKKLFEDMSILSGNDSGIFVKLSKLSQNLGKHEDALAYFDEAYNSAGQKSDSLEIQNEVAKYYLRLGQAKKALEEASSMEKEYRKILPPLVVNSQVWLQLGPMYQFADSIEAFNKEIPLRFPNQDPQSDFLRSLASFLSAMSSENVPVMESEYDKVKPMMLNAVGPAFDDFIKGFISYKKGDTDTGEKFIQAYIDSTGVDIETTGDILFEVYLANSSYDKLTQLTDEVLLSDPYNPVASLYKAKALYRTDKKKDAQLLVDKVLDYYSEADENYKYYREARELKDNLSK